MCAIQQQVKKLMNVEWIGTLTYKLGIVWW